MSDTYFDKTTAGFIANIIEVLPRDLTEKRMRELERSGELRKLLSLMSPRKKAEAQITLDYLDGVSIVLPKEFLLDLGAEPKVFDQKLKEHNGSGEFRVTRVGEKLLVGDKEVKLFLSREQKERRTSTSISVLEECRRTHTPLNANFLDLLIENPGLVPSTWKNTRLILFAGTTFYSFDGSPNDSVIRSLSRPIGKIGFTWTKTGEGWGLDCVTAIAAIEK